MNYNKLRKDELIERLETAEAEIEALKDKIGTGEEVERLEEEVREMEKYQEALEGLVNLFRLSQASQNVYPAFDIMKALEQLSDELYKADNISGYKPNLEVN